MRKEKRGKGSRLMKRTGFKATTGRPFNILVDTFSSIYSSPLEKHSVPIPYNNLNGTVVRLGT
jgi:hypothetical protein